MHATQCVQLFALENVPEVTCPFVCCERNPFWQEAGENILLLNMFFSPEGPNHRPPSSVLFGGFPLDK